MKNLRAVMWILLLLALEIASTLVACWSATRTPDPWWAFAGMIWGSLGAAVAAVFAICVAVNHAWLRSDR